MREKDPADLHFPRLHPAWDAFSLPETPARTLYVNKVDARITSAFPLAPFRGSTCGGFLCDEMGTFGATARAPFRACPQA
jgi:hypothetical protein